MTVADRSMTMPVSHGERVVYGLVIIITGLAMCRFHGSLVGLEHSSVGNPDKGWLARGSVYWRVRQRILQCTGIVLVALGVVLVFTGLFNIG